jgi:hypothetical protein
LRRAVTHALWRGLVGLGSLGQIAKQYALDDLRAMLIDHAHMRRGADADFAQQRYRVFAREVELFCELVHPYCCRHSLLLCHQGAERPISFVLLHGLRALR